MKDACFVPVHAALRSCVDINRIDSHLPKEYSVYKAFYLYRYRFAIVNMNTYLSDTLVCKYVMRVLQKGTKCFALWLKTLRMLAGRTWDPKADIDLISSEICIAGSRNLWE